jgi:hypothetical protein
VTTSAVFAALFAHVRVLLRRMPCTAMGTREYSAPLCFFCFVYVFIVYVGVAVRHSRFVRWLWRSSHPLCSLLCPPVCLVWDLSPPRCATTRWAFPSAVLLWGAMPERCVFAMFRRYSVLLLAFRRGERNHFHAFWLHRTVPCTGYRTHWLVLYLWGLGFEAGWVSAWATLRHAIFGKFVRRVPPVRGYVWFHIAVFPFACKNAQMIGLHLVMHVRCARAHEVCHPVCARLLWCA